MKNVKLVGFSIIVILLGTIVLMIFDDGGTKNKLLNTLADNKEEVKVSKAINPNVVGGELSNTVEEGEVVPTSKVALDARNADFIEEGNLMGDELVYEKPGRPAIRVKLVFNSTSWCENKPCLMGANPSMVGKYEDGTRVKISGEKEGEAVKVYVLNVVD